MHIDELITSVKREISMRKKVYPGWVTQGRMTKKDADHELAAMQEVLRILRREKLIQMGMPPINARYEEGSLERYALRHPGGEVMVAMLHGKLHGAWGLESLPVRVEGLVHLLLPGGVDYIQDYRDKYPRIELAHIPTPLTTQRIATFCAAYKAALGQPYTVTKMEAGQWAKMDDVPAVEDELAYYFRTTTYPLNGTKCVADYLRHYASLRAMMAQQGTDADGLPSGWNAKVYATLEKENPQAWQAYRVKLKKAGYREVNTPTGKIWTQ